MCSKVTTNFQRALQGRNLEGDLLFEALIEMSLFGFDECFNEQIKLKLNNKGDT